MIQTQIDKIKATAEWKALEEHIQQCIDILDSCSMIPDDADFEKVARGRAEAVKILIKILEPFGYNPQPVMDARKEALKRLGYDENEKNPG